MPDEDEPASPKSLKSPVTFSIPEPRHKKFTEPIDVPSQPLSPREEDTSKTSSSNRPVESLKRPESFWLRASTTFDPASDTFSPPLNHRVSISVTDLPPVPKPSGQLTSETQQPRWWLRTQAIWWRIGMRIGMRIHDWAPPPPPKPSFHRYIETKTVDGKASTPIDLAFYTPPDYRTRIKAGHRYPVVVNYHGGGFVMGSNLDDRYWFRVILEETPCIVVSVGYRRAPEFPFPTPVDDCVDTLLYLSSQCLELGLDTSRVVLSGFSAGANFTFTVPLRLKYHTSRFSRRGRSICLGNESELSRFDSTKRLLATSGELNIVGIVAWYPLVDFATPRDYKRSISLKPKKTMPKFFTNLFDQSYLPGTSGINHSSPYVSPGRAPEGMLKDALPHNIQLYLCEWDMLLREGQMFAGKLKRLGKNVTDTLVKEQPHAWDKSPKPWRNQQAINEFYSDACKNLRIVLDEPIQSHEPKQSLDEIFTS